MNHTEQMGLQAPALHPETALCCRPAPLLRLPAEEDLYYCPLLHTDPAELLETMEAAPQFRSVRPRRLLTTCRGNLQVVLLAQDDYHARQAALHLASLRSHLREEQGNPEEDEEEAMLRELIGCQEEDDDPRKDALLVVEPRLLDADLAPRKPGTIFSSELKPEELSSPALLIAAKSGPVLTPGVLGRLELLYAQHAQKTSCPPDVFIALSPDQMDLELLETLRFTWGFQVCRVGQPDLDYYCRYLQQAARGLMLRLSATLDPVQVLQELRRYRGSLCEEDIDSLLAWAVQKQLDRPLTAQDLRFSPCVPERSGRKKLEAMVGLEELKAKLHRILSASVLAARRRQSGKSVTPPCRNLAFSGPPGTGKSVAARLMAQILREEGCGTGRFVEAGREQLIGTYLGQTSPMVAKLFERARGGVLFVDEVGALVIQAGDRDSYAAEAVNALVRHMELEPETMVIFATYPKEMEQFLSANPGLASRIAQVLDFSGYTDAQLWDILGVLAEQEGEALPGEAREDCLAFFRQLREQRKEQFGNGREARRLLQTALEELSLRVEQGEEDSLTAEDLRRAAAYLLRGKKSAQAQVVGFRV